MPKACNGQNDQGRSRWRRRGGLSRLCFTLALFAATLAGCDQLTLSPPIPEATVTAIQTRPPRPTATPFVLRSESLHSVGARHTGVTSLNLASLPAGAVLPPAPAGDSERGVTVLLDAGTRLPGALYQTAIRPAPAILMLGADLSAWGALPQQLSQAGFVVLALQAGALTPARQVDAMLQSLIAIPGVDAGRIGMIGEARAADLAMLGCAVNTLCDALALLSPISRATLVNMLGSFGERPLWLAASRNDSESHAAVLALSQRLRGQAQLVVLEAGRGAALLSASPGLAEQLVAWFAHQLQDS